MLIMIMSIRSLMRKSQQCNDNDGSQLGVASNMNVNRTCSMQRVLADSSCTDQWSVRGICLT